MTMLRIEPLAMVVARNVRTLRAGRGWSGAEFAARATVAGHDLSRNVLANLETGRRMVVSVDELAAFAAALVVEPWSLTTDEPVCLACRNDAPAGFACLTCGRGRPTVEMSTEEMP